MNKTRGTEILTALVNEGFNASLQSLQADDESVDTDYILTVNFAYGTTLSEARSAQRALDQHGAQLILPTFQVRLNEEIEEEQRRKAAFAESLTAEPEPAPEPELPPEVISAEQAGGRSGDFPDPEGNES